MGHRSLALLQWEGPSAPACTDCGCCCWSDAADYIEVFAVDAARMDAATLAQATVEREGRRFLRFERGRCVNLMIAEDGIVGCRIYPMRPDGCRWLVWDSGECHRQIRAKRAKVMA